LIAGGLNTTPTPGIHIYCTGDSTNESGWSRLYG
jgi:hypothetical protein